jgi:cell division protein FtsQ
VARNAAVKLTGGADPVRKGDVYRSGHNREWAKATGEAPVIDYRPPRKGVLGRRRGNRRTVVQRRSLLLLIWSGLTRLARTSWRLAKLLGKVLAVLGALAGVLFGGHWAIRQVVDSPRFRVQRIDIAATLHTRQDELLALAEVAEGDRLLAIDTDAVATRVARHPWIAAAKVSRHLPSTLKIELTERRAMAMVAIDGLYLVDETGRPFKRARMDEGDGLPIFTGIGRETFAKQPEAGAAAFREAMGLVNEYRSRPGRPSLSEVNIDPRFGFSLVLLEGGAEIRLGRGETSKKLARFDQILEAVSKEDLGGLPAVRVVNLDLGGGRVPALLRGRDGNAANPQVTTKPAKN